METTGARLKKLRLEKGISLEEVQKKTKIHPDILKSIEDDSLVNLNPVYIKGFVKIYCGFLGVDPGEYLSGYKENGTVVPAARPGESGEKSFGAAGAKKFFLKPQILAIVAMVVVFVFLTLGITQLVRFVIKSGSRKSRTHLVLPKPTKKTEKRAVSKPKTVWPDPSPQKKAENVKPAAAAVAGLTDNQESEVRIGLHALDDCWVQARIDGKIVFQNILKKGRFESWSGKDKVELALGSAGSVRLEVNGKLIPSLGRNGQVLKNILITKDGLKVGK